MYVDHRVNYLQIILSRVYRIINVPTIILLKSKLYHSSSSSWHKTPIYLCEASALLLANRCHLFSLYRAMTESAPKQKLQLLLCTASRIPLLPVSKLKLNTSEIDYLGNISMTKMTDNIDQTNEL